MKDINIHKEYGDNLVSIKPIDDNYPDRQYLASIIKGIFSLTGGCVCVEASRPNYKINDLINRLKTALYDNDNLKFTDFEIFFSIKEISEKILDLLPIIWFAYEHISFCFFIEDEIELDIKRKPWYEITMKSKSYVLFKGIEEDVIWIGKNGNVSNLIF